MGRTRKKVKWNKLHIYSCESLQLVKAGKHGAFHIVLVVIGWVSAFLRFDAESNPSLAILSLYDFGTTLVRSPKALTGLPTHFLHQQTSNIRACTPKTIDTDLSKTHHFHPREESTMETTGVKRSKQHSNRRADELT